jgi:hypothetical protein
MERWVKDLKATPSQLEINKSYFPGELETASDVRLRKDSIVLPNETADELPSNAQNSALQPRSSGEVISWVLPPRHGPKALT